MRPLDRASPATPPAAPDNAPDKPLVIASTGAHRTVTATDAAARCLGLRPGMPLAQARALVPGLDLADADPDADADGLHRLALWALRYSPVAATDPPDGLWVDVTGASHLHGGERPLLDDLVKRLAAMGIVARAALAGTPGAAHAIARYGRQPVTVVPPADLEGAVEALPLAGLRLPPETVVALRRLGFATVGDLEHTPRAPLTRRFGPVLNRRLDQLHGRVAEPLTPVIPSAAIQARRTLVEPIGTAEALGMVIHALVDDLCRQLECKGLGARTLDLLFHRVDGTWQTLRIGTARPARSRPHLSRLLSERIETVDPGFGVEAAILTATLAEPLKAEDGTLLKGDPAGGAAGSGGVDVLVDVLGNRIGHDRIFRCAPLESDVPERSVARIPALAPAVAGGRVVEWPRPSRLLVRPEPIETLAMLPDHPPAAFTWRGVRRLIRRADGPERIFGEWWKREAETAAARDYYAVEDEAGNRFWLYRSWRGSPETGPVSWFIHGLFG